MSIAPDRNELGLRRHFTIDGISLTLAALDANAGWVEVALIPETLERTTLGAVKVGDRVNIETDIITRTIAYQLENYFSAHG